MIGVVNLLEDGRIDYSRKGFTSIINGLIEVCFYHYEKYNNLNIHMSDPRVEVFFDLPKLDLSKEESYYVTPKYIDDLIKYDFPDYNAHNIVKDNDIEIRNEIFNKLFKLKPNITFEDEVFDIGLHIRGTDKISEVPKLNDDNIINTLNSYTKNSDKILKLFIATDEFKYVELIRNNVNNVDIRYFDDNVISYDGNPIHFINDTKKIDFEVLRDVYLLKNCKTLFYCYSNVSLLSIMIGFKSFNEKILLNSL
jgi:hypothetical protein